MRHEQHRPLQVVFQAPVPSQAHAVYQAPRASSAPEVSQPYAVSPTHPTFHTPDAYEAQPQRLPLSSQEPKGAQDEDAHAFLHGRRGSEPPVRA